VGNISIGKFIGLILVMPVVFSAVIFLMSNMNNPDALINYLPKYIESAVMPWEVGVIEWVLGFGAIVGVVLLIIFIEIYNYEI